MWGRRGVKSVLLLPAMRGIDPSPGLFVLIYHRVGAGMAAEMDVSAARFAEQMRMLQERSDVVPLADGLAELAEGRAPERDRVAVTFDDGYADVFTNAWPVLRDLGIPATVFVTTDFLEGRMDAPLSRAIPSRVPPRALAWEQVGEMTATGLVAIGSHSATHPDFDRISSDRAAQEVELAADLIASRTGAQPEIFAFPRGVVAHRDAVAARHRFALGADGQKNRVASFDPLAVSRTPVRRSDGMFFFRKRLAGMRPLEDGVYARLKRRGSG